MARPLYHSDKALRNSVLPLVSLTAISFPIHRAETASRIAMIRTKEPDYFLISTFPLLNVITISEPSRLRSD